MARLFLSDPADGLNAVRAHWRLAGLREGAAPKPPGPRERRDLAAATALKRAIGHDNALVHAPDRWVLGVGTYLTEAGETGAAALARVATALTAPDPRAAREALIGHYALVARNGDRVVAMADPIATHDLFLRRSGGGMALATFLSDMLIGGAVGEIDEVDALRAAYLGEAGLAGRTILPGVRSLRGHEWLEGDLGRRDADRWTVRGAPPGPTAPWPDMDAALQGYAHETGRVFGALAGIGPVAINVTGGLDSRLAAAAARAAGVEPGVLYGRGDSRMTNTRAEDLAVVRRAARL